MTVGLTVGVRAMMSAAQMADKLVYGMVDERVFQMAGRMGWRKVLTEVAGKVEKRVEMWELR